MCLSNIYHISIYHTLGIKNKSHSIIMHSTSHVWRYLYSQRPTIIDTIPFKSIKLHPRSAPQSPILIATSQPNFHWHFKAQLAWHLKAQLSLALQSSIFICTSKSNISQHLKTQQRLTLTMTSIRLAKFKNLSLLEYDALSNLIYFVLMLFWNPLFQNLMLLQIKFILL